MTEHAASLRVLVFAPVGRDNQLTAELLARASIQCHTCRSIAELCREMDEGAGAVLLTEEVLANPDVDTLAKELAGQPAWSDISVLLFAGGDREQPSLRTLHKLEVLRNVTLLDRPIRTAAVLSTLRAALRSRQRQYELRDVLLALHRARIEAEEASRLKDEFLATVSHELRTPLNAILGWVAMLQQARFDQTRVAGILKIIERNARAQAQLIGDVLDISRMISGRVKLDVALVSVARVISDAVDSVRPAAAAKGIEVRMDVDEGPVVNADPDRLQQVVWNLLSNACKFTPEGGRINVSLVTDDASARIVVADNGTGISPEFLPFVFDRFRQAEQGFTRAHGGLGLGLAIVKHLVEMHGGTVTGTSAGTGRGARFEVCLPLSAAAVLRGRRTANMEEESVLIPDVDLSNGLVLVVDDDETTRDLVETILVGQGARVKTAESVKTAIAAIDVEVPGLLIADIGMPEEDGLSMIRRIRQRSPGHGGLVSAVALSAYARADDRDAAIAAGYDDFLTKPVMPADIIRTAGRLLNKSGRPMRERGRRRRQAPQRKRVDRRPSPRQ